MLKTEGTFYAPASKKSGTGSKKINADKEAVKMLWLELGASEAARRLSLPVGTITGWASRYKWAANRPASLTPKVGGRKRTVAIVSQSPSNALAEAATDFATRTRTALSRTAVETAEAVAASGPLIVRSTSHWRDVVSASSALFGWNSDKVAGNTFNTLVISPEQIERIRSAAGV